MTWQMLEQAARVAPFLTAVVAVAAFFVAWRQLRLNRRNQRETTAKAIWREYLKLAFEYPKLASGNIHKMSPDEFSKYEWFIGHLLWGVEEVLFFSDKDQIWQENIRQQLLFHREYFRTSEAFQTELKGYNPAVQQLVKRAVMTA